MDRNLGAMDIEEGDNTKGYGTYYQYGRKDPVPTTKAYAADGKLLYDQQPELVYASSTFTLAYSVNNPSIMVEGDEWCYKNEYASAIWNNPSRWYTIVNEKSFFDPCPEGWKIPRREAWTTIANVNNQIYWNFGAALSLGGNTTGEKAYFPSSGNRGDLTGGFGSYRLWTTTRFILCGCNSTNVYLISNGSVSTSSIRRSNGRPIRCIQE